MRLFLCGIISLFIIQVSFQALEPISAHCEYEDLGFPLLRAEDAKLAEIMTQESHRSVIMNSMINQIKKLEKK